MKSHTARLLKSVGKEIFVAYFDAWNAPDIAERLRRDRGYSENAANTRVLKARRIREKPDATLEALQIIVASDKVSPETLAAARGFIFTGKF